MKRRRSGKVDVSPQRGRPPAARVAPRCTDSAACARPVTGQGPTLSRVQAKAVARVVAAGRGRAALVGLGCDAPRPALGGDILGVAAVRTPPSRELRPRRRVGRPRARPAIVSACRDRGLVALPGPADPWKNVRAGRSDAQARTKLGFKRRTFSHHRGAKLRYEGWAPSAFALRALTFLARVLQLAPDATLRARAAP